jgi:hypothetical protein
MNANPIRSVPPSVATPVPARPAAPRAETPAPQLPASPGPNPALRVDPQLGIVVLEFQNAQGKTTSSLPTERALAEYRRTGHPAGPAHDTTPAEKSPPAKA